MPTCDPHRFSNQLEISALERLVERLEQRAQMPVFMAPLDRYVQESPLLAATRLLEIGCGTGVVLLRVILQHGFTGESIGIDQSPFFIDTARHKAAMAGISESKLRFQLGDSHHIDFPDASFDVVIAHTVLSHVTDPNRVLQEVARVLRPGGTLIIFEGDYASLTFALPDYRFAQEVDHALVKSVFNHPRIVRDLPRLIAEFGLRLERVWGDAMVEVGKGEYFNSLVETYTPNLRQSGLLPSTAIDIWLTEQRRASAIGTFFAGCTYYTFLLNRLQNQNN